MARRSYTDHPFWHEAQVYRDLLKLEKGLAARRSSIIAVTEDEAKRLRWEIRRLEHLARIDIDWLDGKV